MTKQKLELVQMAFYPGGNHNEVSGKGWDYYSASDTWSYSVIKSPLIVQKHALWYLTPYNIELKELSAITSNIDKRFVVCGYLDRPECNMNSWSPEVYSYAAKQTTKNKIEDAIKEIKNSGGTNIEVGIKIDIREARKFLPDYQKRKIEEIREKKDRKKQLKIEEFLSLSPEEQRKRLEGIL